MAADPGKTADFAERLPPMAYLAVFVVSFCVYALSASPAIGWLDSPEFIAQSLSLGVAHSPGHPLVGMLGYLAALVPIGDKVWRVNLMSGLCAAAAITLLAACAQRLLWRIDSHMPRGSSTLLAVSIAAFAAFSWALWSNAVRAEVYALQALLSIAAILALLRYEDSQRPADLLIAAFLLALGLANHHLLTLTILVPGAVFVLWRAPRPGFRLAGYTAGIGIVGLCALLYLPVRSLTHPLVNFGAPHTLERFSWTLRGAAFAKSAQEAHVSTPLVDALEIIEALSHAISWPLLLLAGFAAYLGVRQPSQRRSTMLLVGIVVLCLAARVLLGFDPETSDHHAYLLPAMLALWLLSMAGVAQLCRLAQKAARPVHHASAISAAAMLLLAPIQFATQWEKANQASSWASDDLANWSLRDLPPNSLVLSAYFQTRFRLWAMQAVEGVRPDVAILDRSFLTYPGMAAEARIQYPELTQIIESPLRAGYASPMALLYELAKERPVFAELHPNLDAQLASALRPHGAFASYGAQEDKAYDQEARLRLVAALASATPAERGDARAALLWHDGTHLTQFCFLGNRDQAARVYADALRIAPEDEMLGSIARSCGLTTP